MNTINQIQHRIGLLKEAENAFGNEARRATDSKQKLAAYKIAMDYAEEVAAIEKLLAWLSIQQPEEAQEKNLQPLVSFKKRTPEEDQVFHRNLIFGAINNYFKSVTVSEGVAYFEKLHSYLIAISNSIMIAQQIDRLEKLEYIVNKTEDGEGEAIDPTPEIKDWVDKELHADYKTLQTLHDNCAILEKELNITE
jgi:hypothetical protein